MQFWIAFSLFVIAYAAGSSSLDLETLKTSTNTTVSPRLLLAQRGGVVQIDLVTHETGLLVNTSAAGVDFHYRRNLLFWCDDYSKKTVYMKRFDEPALTTYTVIGSWLPIALAVDWITDKLYVADRLSCKVHVFDLNTSWQAVVLDKLSEPSDIALDPLAGLMFVGDEKLVIRANMDGTQSKVIVTEDVDYSETGLALDLEAKKLYYCNSLLDYIQSVDYDGNRKHIVLKSPEPNAIRPTRLALFEGIYWSNSIDKNVGLAIGPWNTSLTIQYVYNTSVDKDLTEPKGLKVFHPLQQPLASNPCAADNGKCSHLCVLTSRKGQVGFRCICNSGYILQSDGKTCVAPKEFLLYTAKSNVYGKFLDSIPGNLTDTMHLDVSRDSIFAGLDLDSKHGYIYYTDIVNHVVYRMNKNGTGNEKILNISSAIEGLAFDWLANNLYFADYTLRSINVLSTVNGAYKQGLIKNLDKPRGIAVYPSKGLLFFADWGVSRIFKANSDGSEVTVIVNSADALNGLSIDFETNRLYWCNKRNIHHSTLDGRDVKEINSEYIGRPFSIAVFKGYVYFSSWSQQAVIRINKFTGKDERILDKKKKGVFFGIKIYSSEVQPTMDDHPCFVNNGRCQEFCFAISNNNILSAKCQCSDGKRLAPDNTCVNI